MIVIHREIEGRYHNGRMGKDYRIKSDFTLQNYQTPIQKINIKKKKKLNMFFDCFDRHDRNNRQKIR